MNNSWLKNLALAFASFLFMAVLMEVGLRFYGRVNWTEPNDVIGWSFIPNAEYKFAKVPEGCPGWGSSGRVNSHGLRDREFSYEKPLQTFRILALGDSYTEALQFDLEKTWTKVLEQNLNTRNDGWRYEVINAGRSGMGTTHEYLFFQYEGYKYNADLVIVLFIPNDWTDNSKELAEPDAYGPYFVLDNDDLKLDNSFRDERGYRFRSAVMPFKKASYLFSFLMYAYSQAQGVEATQRADVVGKPIAITASDLSTPIPMDEEPLYAPARSPQWDEAFEVTKHVVVRLDRAVAEKQSSFLLVNGTSSNQVNKLQVERAKREHPDWNIDRPGEFLRSVADSARIPFLDLVATFRKVSEGGAFLHGCTENKGRGHWNIEGHKLAASSISDFLSRSNLLPSAN